MCSIAEFPFHTEPLASWLLTPVRISAGCPSDKLFESGVFWVTSTYGFDVRSAAIGTAFLILSIVVMRILFRSQIITQSLALVATFIAGLSVASSVFRGATPMAIATIIVVVLCWGTRWYLASHFRRSLDI